MIQIIAVDDEPKILGVLPKIIRWNDYGCELTRVFSRSRDAVDYLALHHTDVVISDIRMPEMDGLALAGYLKEHFPQTLVVLLSAYRDFAYAQQAISLNVFEYLTKPLSFGSLEKLLGRLQQHFGPANAEDSLTFWERQQAMLDLAQKKLSFREAAAVLSPGGEDALHDSAVIIFHISLTGLLDFLKTDWPYGIDRLYASLFSLLDSFGGEFVPIHCAFDSLDLACLVPSSSPDAAERQRGRLCEDVPKLCRENLHLEASVSAPQIFPRLSEAFGVIRKLSRTETTPPAADSGNEAIASAMSYIVRNLAGQCSLIDAADHVHLSPYHFSRLFKKETGKNYSDYVLDQRLLESRRLLASGKYTIAQTAEKAGFGSTNYFYRVFKGSLGVTPHEYILQARKEAEEEDEK